jgi:hypothetical protein
MIADVPTGAWIAWLGALITWACAAPYALEAARGDVAPSWVSWSVWTSTTGLATAAAMAAGSPKGALVPGIAFVRCVAVLAGTAIGVRRARERGQPRDPTTRLDWGCLAACIVTGAVWLATGNPILALAAAVTTDGVAAIPTYRNAWNGQESALNWAGAAAPPLLTILILQDRDFATWAYPLYELTLTSTLTALIIFRALPPAPSPPPWWHPSRRNEMTAHLIVRRPDGRPDLAVALSPEHATDVVALLIDVARESAAELIVIPLSPLRRH